MQLPGYLSPLFNPASVAVVGASRNSGKAGHLVLANLLNSLNAGYSGKIFPINHAAYGDSEDQNQVGRNAPDNATDKSPNKSAHKILGLEVLRNLREIPAASRPLDLAIIAVPAPEVPGVLHDLAAIQGRAAIIMSSGFKEVGGEGARLEAEVLRLAREAGIALLGPNSLGYVNAKNGLNATFYKYGHKNAPQNLHAQGGIGFFSQSGALFSALLNRAACENTKISSFISLGNKTALDESEMLAHFAQDNATKVIAGYLESIENGPQFMKQAQMLSRKKPIIILRSGGTPAGGRAASAHTGAFDGPDMAYAAAFKQTGIIRAKDADELFQLARSFATQPLPTGPGLAIVTNSGGPGIMAADACAESGLAMAALAGSTVERLKNILPAYASFFNPVDVNNDAGEERLAAAVDIVLTDPSVHALLVLVTPPNFSSMSSLTESLLATFSKHKNKTIFCCFMGGGNIGEAEKAMLESGYPCFRVPEPAVRAIAAMYRHSLWKQTPLPVEVGYRRDLNRVQKIIAAARANYDQNSGLISNNLSNCGLTGSAANHVAGMQSYGLIELDEARTQELLQAYEMPLLKSKLARTSDEAAQIAKQFGQAVALKISSPQIPHRSDVDGVVLGLHNQAAVRNAFSEITARAKKLRSDAYIAGCQVQVMAPRGSHEITVGFKRDRRFGAMVFFGYGADSLDTFNDLSCRIAPLSLEDVSAMIRESRAFPVLTGLRGQRPINMSALEDVLLIMSQIAQDFAEIQEASCNPVLVSEHGAAVAEMRVLLSR